MPNHTHGTTWEMRTSSGSRSALSQTTTSAAWLCTSRATADGPGVHPTTFTTSTVTTSNRPSVTSIQAARITATFTPARTPAELAALSSASRDQPTMERPGRASKSVASISRRARRSLASMIQARPRSTSRATERCSSSGPTGATRSNLSSRSMAAIPFCRSRPWSRGSRRFPGNFPAANFAR